MPERSHPILLLAALIIAGIAILHFLALAFSLYWRWPWYDSLMHSLGGAWLGAISVWFFGFSPYESLRRFAAGRLFLITLVFSITVNVLWEVFEYALGVTFAVNYWSDTAGDLFFDVVGFLAVFAALGRFFPLPKTSV